MYVRIGPFLLLLCLHHLPHLSCLFQYAVLNLGEEREIKREGEGEVSSGECWSEVMTERQQGDYCAILSRVLSGAWKYKVTILHDNPQVITRSLLLFWSSCHASRCGSCSWKIHFIQVFRQSVPKYKNQNSYCPCLMHAWRPYSLWWHCPNLSMSCQDTWGYSWVW